MVPEIKVLAPRKADPESRRRTVLPWCLLPLLLGLSRVAATAGDSGSRKPALRALAAARGLRIGTAVAFDPLQKDPLYRQVLEEQFNMVTPENVMQFHEIHPRPGPGPANYEFSKADAIVSHAAAKGMLVRGHSLVWEAVLPEWVLQGKSAHEIANILREHIQTVAGRYKGKVYSWDVVNEAGAIGGVRDIPLSHVYPAYIADAFRWARQADPEAKLFYNDYALEYSRERADKAFELVRGLKAKGVPIDGVGLEAHLVMSDFSCADMQALIRRFASLGVEVAITETDVRMDNPWAHRPVPMSDPRDPAVLQRQAELFACTLSACLSERACKAYVMWGFTDKYSWLAGAAPTIMDKDLNPKPAFAALQEVLLSGSSSGGRQIAPRAVANANAGLTRAKKLVEQIGNWGWGNR